MEINLKDLKNRISHLSNEELIKMLTVEKDEYAQEALDLANEEAQSRGGHESIQKKHQQKLTKEQKNKEEKQKRKEEVAKNYSFFDHVINIWVRRSRVYGIIVIFWWIYKISTERGLGITEILSTSPFWIGIVFLFILSIIYAFISALSNYGKTLENSFVTKCSNCKKAFVMAIDKAKMKVDESHFYNTSCKFCKSPVKVNLNFAFNKANQTSKDKEEVFKKEVKEIDYETKDIILSSIEADQYLGPFQRQKWKIDLTHKEAIFYNLSLSEEKIVIPKRNILELITFKSGRTVNTILKIQGRELKFIIFDLNDFYNWVPESELE